MPLINNYIAIFSSSSLSFSLPLYPCLSIYLSLFFSLSLRLSLSLSLFLSFFLPSLSFSFCVFWSISDGYGFKHNSTITVLDQVNGNKVGWPLGAILYEINSLPWELEQPEIREPWGKFFLAATIGTVVRLWHCNIFPNKSKLIDHLS